MNLQPASRRELRRIAWGTLACDGFLITGLFLMSRFGIGTFDLPRILLGAAGGSAIALLNFAILCLTVQRAVSTETGSRKVLFQLSYHLRLGLQAAWIVFCAALKAIPLMAGAAPILFPSLLIFYIQFKESRKTRPAPYETGGDGS